MAFSLPSWSNLEGLVSGLEAEFNTIYTVLSSVPAANAVIQKLAPQKIVSEAEGALSLAEGVGATVAQEFNPSHNPAPVPASSVTPESEVSPTTPIAPHA